MTKNQIKIGLVVLLLAIACGPAFGTSAYPPFVRQAVKFGAKDCTFCHTNAEGGDGWNTRGQWLIAEKERRKADAIDVSWLAEYKEPEPGAEKEPAKEPAKEKEPKEKEPKEKEPEKQKP